VIEFDMPLDVDLQTAAILSTASAFNMVLVFTLALIRLQQEREA